MATTMSALLARSLTDLRYEPTGKRVRARLNGSLVADSSSALLVWEPRRVVPVYAVPERDVRADLVTPADGVGDPQPPAAPGPVYPLVPFAVHTTPGTSYDVRTGTGTAARAAFVPTDADLAGHVVLDGDAFDWFEEDEQVGGHPRDPFHRVDVRRSDREVTVHVGGTLVARSTRPLAVFETGLPTRWYLPREDVLATLEPTATSTTCAYKGAASYWSLTTPDGEHHEDVAWSYEAPFPDAVALAGAVAFYPDRSEISVGA